MVGKNIQALAAVVIIACIALSSELRLGSLGAFQPAISSYPVQERAIQEQAIQEEQVKNPTVRKARIPIENVTWVGTQYFLPDGYTIYNPSELGNLASRYPMLWIGDSTMRRAMLTWQLMLQPNRTQWTRSELEHSRNMNVNKQWNSSDHPWANEHCDRYTNETIYPLSNYGVICRDIQGTYSDFFGICCLNETLQLMNKNPTLFANYRIIVLSLGLYDILGRCEGLDFRGAEYNYTRAQRIEARRQYVLITAPKLFHTVSNLPDTLVVFRTMGFHEQEKKNDDSKYVNEKLRNMIRTNFTKIKLVDWATAVYPRSIGKDRIEGDNGYHYGHEARILFLQMLANTVVDELEPSS